MPGGVAGRAKASAGPLSAVNRLWFNAKLKPPAFDLAAARKLLAADGLRNEGDALRDRQGRPVEFSLITNAGNRARERAASTLQEDLAALGIRLNIVTLDFAALLERIGKTFQYESCLLGLINMDEDPNSVMNIFLSSAANHF